MNTGSGPVTVSLNGVDNIGKTTQLRWLHRALPGAHLVGSIDRWHPGWRQVAADDFARWWFEESSTAEHVGLVMRSHVARRHASDSCTQALEDRGLPMLNATCAATAVIKDRLPPALALQTVQRLGAELAVAPARREIHILLRFGADPAVDAAHSLDREPFPPGERYAAYQHALAEILAMQAERGEYDAVLEVSELPILDIQRMVRETVAAQGIQAEPLPPFTPELVWVLGGMSESGKSTVGALLRDEHGVTRLKIGYLLEVAAARKGVDDPYEAWSEQNQAEHLAEELLRCAAATKADTISLESAHRYDATAHLKRLLGDRCRIMFIEASPEVRARRAAETMASLHRRDATKSERGADRIITIADDVLDNSGPMCGLKLAVSRLYFTAHTATAQPEPKEPESNTHWLRQATEHLVDEQVALVLATGSTSTATWRSNWSDLDILVVRDELSAAWLRTVAGTVRAPEGVKLGISAFSPGDIAARRVPPRVIQSLRRAAVGSGVLYRRHDYAIPLPSAAEADRTSRGELGLVLMTTRRLLAVRELDVRALYKHLALLAKIVLRAESYEFTCDEDVLAAFRDHHPSAACSPPSVRDLIDRPDDPTTHRQLTQATDRLLVYLEHLDHRGGQI